MDLELDRFKRANLADFAASHGYRLVRREPTRNGGSRGSTTSSLLMRNPTTNDKIVVRLDGDGHWTYFSVRDDRDNGTIIDFALRRGARTLGHVREQLRAWAGEHHTIEPWQRVRPSMSAAGVSRPALREVYAGARVVSNHPYLNGRGVRPETLSSPRFTGTWRVSARGDLLFPHHDGPNPDDVCGFERKSASFAGFSAGGIKTLWTSNSRADDARLVITEAVIDAFSYHQLQPNDGARYVSTCGSFGQRQAHHVGAAIARMPGGSVVVIATDNDEPGETLAEKIAPLVGEALVERHRPPIGKDWNECLQRHERDYIRSLGMSRQGRAR